MSQPVCLFALWSPEGILFPHQTHYLSELKSCGFRIVLAFSGAIRLPYETLAFCDVHDIETVLRQNAGLDFGAWSDLNTPAYLRDATEILLTNDSIIGPFAPLAPPLRRLREKQADISGMVGSRLYRPHLQSWFLLFKRKAFDRPAIQRIFALPFASMSRDEIIWHGELGIAAAAQAEKLTLGALWHPNIMIDRWFPLNPMHFQWEHLITDGHVPFVKAELLRSNAFNVPTRQAWENICHASGFSPEDIQKWLETRPQRASPAPSPLRRLFYRALAFIDRHAGRHQGRP